jgi:hypothetical protein
MVDSFGAGSTTRDSVADRDQAAADRGNGGNYNDPYGFSRNTPWGPQSPLDGLMSYGPLGALLGAINDPTIPKSLSTPGEGGYDTRDGGGRGGFGGQGGYSMNNIMDLLRRYGAGQQQPFQFAPPPSQGNMPQIAPPGGMPSQGPQNINDLYSLYGATPNTPMPAPAQAPPTQVPPTQGPSIPAPYPGGVIPGPLLHGRS